MIKTPVVIVNFKAYAEASGSRAVELAKICEKAASETGVEIVVAVQAADIASVSSSVSIPVFSQHTDPDEPGAHTGSITAESVKSAGASGTLLNHSEKRLSSDVLEKSIKTAKSAGLAVVVCAKDSDEGKTVSVFEEDFVAVEPPELIGGKISVSSAKPELISDSVSKICGETSCNRVLVGAGVKTREDASKATELGASGVLVASGIVKSEDSLNALKELAFGLKR